MNDTGRHNLHKNTALGLRWCPALVQRRYLARVCNSDTGMSLMIVL